MSERCLFCDKKLKQPKQGRERLYCDANCRQKSHQRKKDKDIGLEETPENRLKMANKRIRELEGENTKLKADLIFCQTEGGKEGKSWVEKEMGDFRSKINQMEVDCIMAGFPTKETFDSPNHTLKENDKPKYFEGIISAIENGKGLVVEHNSDSIKIENIGKGLEEWKPKEPKSVVEFTPPKTLIELKELCPPELKGFDRSTWISKNRRKYGI